MCRLHTSLDDLGMVAVTRDVQCCLQLSDTFQTKWDVPDYPDIMGRDSPGTSLR